MNQYEENTEAAEFQGMPVTHRHEPVTDADTVYEDEPWERHGFGD